MLRRAAGPIKILIVDDSPLMRQILTEMLSKEDDMRVVGSAADPLVAREMIKQLNPDVMTLDIEMPRMDGLAFLEKVMTLRPMPVVMVSTLTEAGAEATLQALEIGAVDFFAKPKSVLRDGMERNREELVAKVRAAAGARLRPPSVRSAAVTHAGGGYAPGTKIVAIGSSTGGVEALRDLITSLPADFPAVLIAQHMPPKFTASFAARLDGLSKVTVREATDEAPVLPGHVYIAPGEAHLLLARTPRGYICRLGYDGLVSGHRPSADVLFQSVAVSGCKDVVGVILTGMGKDGAQGLLKLREAGAFTIGQDERSCLVYGMPKAAMAIGAVCSEVALSRIVPDMIGHFRKK
jgi:two-component system chemotaxis response regulator CheB